MEYSNNKSLVGVLWSFCPWTLLLLWTVHSVLLPARLNEKWDERSLFRVFHTFPTRTCRDSIIWFRFASYRFRIPTDVDHLRRRGRRRCVYGIYGTGSDGVQIPFQFRRFLLLSTLEIDADASNTHVDRIRNYRYDTSDRWNL